MVTLNNKTANNLGPYNGLLVPANQSANVSGAIAPFISDGVLLSDVVAGNMSVTFAGTEVLNAAAASLLMQLGQILNTDSDGANLSRVKQAPTGWTYNFRGFEFTTSTANSVVNNDPYNNPLSDAIIKFYDANGNQLTQQSDLDSSCTVTMVDMEPPYDYYLIGGEAVALTVPTDDARLSVIVAPDYPAPIGSKAVIQSVNMRYVPTGDKIYVDGRASKGLLYNNPAPHTNKLRFIIYHTVGAKYSFEIHLETYRQ